MIKHDFYITPEEYEIAEANGIDKRTLENRVRKYCWSKKRAMSEPIRRRGRYTKWYKIAESNGISRGTFIARVNICGWDYERAATESIKTIEEKAIIMMNSRKVYSDQVYETLKLNGINRNTFAGRIHRGWTVERAMTEKIDTKKRGIKIRSER